MIVLVAPGISIADIRLCVENGRKVYTSYPCKAGITPTFTVQSPATVPLPQSTITTIPPRRVITILTPERSNSPSSMPMRGQAEVDYEQQGRRQALTNYEDQADRQQRPTYGSQVINQLLEPDVRSSSMNTLRPNAYGPGIHANQYGQAVTVAPDFGGQPGEMLQLKQNAYGLGVHMDQFGRPVRESPFGR